MNPHQAPKASIRELFASFWRNRQLILQLAKREVISRYRGSFMGLAWSFFNPILMLTVYTFVFSVIFKSHWAGVEGSKASFAVILFAGLIVHGMFAECASRAPSLILQNTNYVKRVVFPLEVLPWVAMSSAVFHAFVSLIVLLIVQVFLNHTMPLTIVGCIFPSRSPAVAARHYGRGMVSVGHWSLPSRYRPDNRTADHCAHVPFSCALPPFFITSEVSVLGQIKPAHLHT
jgi:lipopolysaccharide transport system permease protein